jgi:uncharacterized membrane protein
MISKWRFMALQFGRRLWVRAGLFALLGIATALLSIVAERFIPWELPGKIGADAVDSILNILASSMLAVTTFSLSVMVQAYGAATQNVTPRATKLVIQDTTTQTVLATFIGTFLFSLVGIIALTTGVYGERGRLVLFLVVLLVIAIVVLALLRWIDHLSRLGRVGETTDRVEKATAAAFAGRIEAPFLGGRAWWDPQTPPSDSHPVPADVVGYVQHVDILGLSDTAEANDLTVYLAAVPGAFVHDGKPLVHVVGEADEDALAAIGGAFTIGSERSFEQDPRFGLAVLAEIASRALSPAVNDPGTAIDVIGRAVRLLLPLAARGDAPGGGEADAHEPAEEPACPRIHVPPLAAADLMDDIFAPIARDGASLIEVQLRLQKALLALAGASDGRMAAAALEQSRRALAHAEAALALPDDVTRLRALVTPHIGERL